MTRSRRTFLPGLMALEGRRLLAKAHAPIPIDENVQFNSTAIPGPPLGTPPTQVVGQQDLVATVVLSRSDNRGRLQVRVATDPSSPAVGVNVGAVDQTVTFPNLAVEAVLTVAILAGCA